MLPTFKVALPLVALAVSALTPSHPAARSSVSAIAAEGWRFKWKVTSESEKKERGPATPSMTVSLIPGKARMDYEGGNGQPGMKKGGYMLLDADKGTMTMVNPEDKQAMIMDPSALGSAMNAIGSSGMVKMDISDVKMAVEPMGAGERLLGYATTKYRITRSHTVSVSVFGRKNTTAHQSVTEAWVADKFIEDRAFTAWAKSFTRGFGNATGDGLKKLMEAEQANMPKGFPLKQVQTSTDTDGKGKVSTSTTTMEMTELTKTSLDASLFEVPTGYEVVDLKAQMAELSEAKAKAKADCEKENGAGSEKCDESAGGSARKALKGLFKKP